MCVYVLRTDLYKVCVYVYFVYRLGVALLSLFLIWSSGVRVCVCISPYHPWCLRCPLEQSVSQWMCICLLLLLLGLRLVKLCVPDYYVFQINSTCKHKHTRHHSIPFTIPLTIETEWIDAYPKRNCCFFSMFLVLPFCERPDH